jgi:hypothetical protein
MHPPFAGHRILIASTPPGESILRRILEPLGAQTLSAVTHEEALDRIRKGVDLVVCSLRFDESRMLDLVAATAALRPHLPFVCCRVIDSDLPHSWLRAAFAAAGHLGAVAVIDFPELARSEGAGHAESELRASVAIHLQGASYASMS